MPTTTPVPDVIFDILAPILTGAEYKILNYIVRRTYGFKKSSDAISLNQILSGIRKKDGTQLDYGAGVRSKATVVKALRHLEKMDIIDVKRHSSVQKGNETSTYRLKFAQGAPANTPSTKSEPGGSTKNELALVQKVNPQETELQETEIQQQAVVALIDLGIAKSVACRLVKSYAAKRVLEKIDFLAYLQETAPDKVSNPRGWLRKAIEEDYGPPDGYRPKAERERKKRQKAKQRQQARRQMKTIRQDEVQTAQRGQAKLEQALQKARQEQGTTPADRALWEKMQPQLKEILSTTLYALAKNSHLLTTEGGKGVIATGNQFAANLLQRELGDRLPELFARHGRPVDSVQIIPLLSSSSDP